MKSFVMKGRLGAALSFILAFVFVGSLAVFAPVGMAQQASGAIRMAHAIAMHGAPEVPEDAPALNFANPNAPRGGILHRAAVGTFDSLNPYIIKGRSAAGITGYHIPTLMSRSWDEPFTLYAYVAERVSIPASRKTITFHLNTSAQFHDGTPITADDVIFSHKIMRDRGTPSKRRAYALVTEVKRVNDHTVTFTFGEQADRETPLLIAMMPVLSQAYYQDRDFEQTSLDIPLGGGPYQITDLEPGRYIVYSRVEDWWGDDLLFFRGQMNFDQLRWDYYRDSGIALEAFRAGEYNYRIEANADAKSSKLDIPSNRRGEIKLITVPHGRPAGMYGFVFNTRRPLFEDVMVRRALSCVFDFDFIKRTYLKGDFVRSESFFANSDLAARPLPAEQDVRELLAQVGADEAIIDGTPPFDTCANADPRTRTRRAYAMLTQRGWTIDDQRLNKDGQDFHFEILLRNASDEKIALAYIDQLSRLGISAIIRTVDSSQYNDRLKNYDFDVTIQRWGVSLSPGSEQVFYWGSESADTPATRNYAGVRDPVVDALAHEVADAIDHERLVVATRALDRVLLSGHYILPLYHSTTDNIAYWGQMRANGYNPLYGLIATVDSWWLESASP
ncbi:MAG: extracellular solute-binding protein [Pseudomonadota bacterium]